ncbi:MAG: hypothetical protein MUD07_06110, partial [Burkholderiaceae bacterium]|nr:hypothetical protein [Burkholderiaceae bacterium]
MTHPLHGGNTGKVAVGGCQHRIAVTLHQLPQQVGGRAQAAKALGLERVVHGQRIGIVNEVGRCPGGSGAGPYPGAARKRPPYVLGRRDELLDPAAADLGLRHHLVEVVHQLALA